MIILGSKWLFYHKNNENQTAVELCKKEYGENSDIYSLLIKKLEAIFNEGEFGVELN